MLIGEPEHIALACQQHLVNGEEFGMRSSIIFNVYITGSLFIYLRASSQGIRTQLALPRCRATTSAHLRCSAAMVLTLNNAALLAEENQP